MRKQRQISGNPEETFEIVVKVTTSGGVEQLSSGVIYEDETAEKVTPNEVKGLKTQAKMLHFVPWPSPPGRAA